METKAAPPLLTSIIRTVVPLLVQIISAQLAAKGIDSGPWSELLAQIVGGVVAALYYTVVRVLETRLKPVWGWLLGAAKPPTYDATAKAEPDSPTGEVAGPASDVADEGDPVETVPTDSLGEPLGSTDENGVFTPAASSGKGVSGETDPLSQHPTDGQPYDEGVVTVDGDPYR